MNKPDSVSAASAPSDRCPACGHPFDDASSTATCSLCGWRSPDERVTSEDRTPYALTLASGRPRWWAMCAWVYTAGRPRLSFVGLLRPSRASRRFARIHLLLVALFSGLAATANVGWFVVKAGPGTLSTTREPSGRGWLHVVSRSAEGGSGGGAAQVIATDAWWNLPLAALTGGAVLCVVLLLGHLLLGWSGRRAERIAERALGQGQRLRCAVQYSSAWCLLLSCGALLAALRPVVAALSVRGSTQLVRLMRGGLDATAILVGLAGVLLWWFWLIRLAGTLPAGHRRRVHTHFLVWTPLLVGLVLGASAVGLVMMLGPMASRLRLNW